MRRTVKAKEPYPGFNKSFWWRQYWRNLTAPCHEEGRLNSLFATMARGRIRWRNLERANEWYWMRWDALHPVRPAIPDEIPDEDVTL